MAEYRDVEDVPGVDEATATTLRTAGYQSVEDLRAADRAELAELDGIAGAFAARIKTDVGDPDIDGEAVTEAGDADAGPSGDAAAGADETACSNCGTAMETVTAEERCSNCGAVTEPRTLACPACDVRRRGPAATTENDVGRRNPAIAVFLSTLLIGAGHLYNHQTGRAVVIFVVGLAWIFLASHVSLLLAVPVPVAVAVDAYYQAKLRNLRSGA